MTTTLAIIAFAFITIQGIATYFQMKAYCAAIGDLRRIGSVAVGRRKAFLKQGKMFILACNNDGVITGAKEMKGFTVFERFKDIDSFNGMSIWDFEEWANEKNKGKVHENIKKRTPEQQAVLGLLNRFKTDDEDIEASEELN